MLISLVSGVALLWLQTQSVREDLEEAVTRATHLRSELAQGEPEQARTTFLELRDRTAQARETTSGPLWGAASTIPGLGQNFHAIREVTISADDVVTQAVEPLLETYGSLDWRELAPKHGRIDTKPLVDSQPVISHAAATVLLSYNRLVAIDTDQLFPSISDPIDRAEDQLRELHKPLEVAATTAKLLPDMMGVDGRRTYLLLVQNNAEARATGGIPGALAVIAADDGRIELGTQSSATAMGPFRPAVDVDRAQELIYTSRLGIHMQNVNLTPDFPTAAQTAKTMWEIRHEGESVDGVITIDPYVLSYLLEATGPVALRDANVLRLAAGTNLPGELTSSNVISTLLSDVYREIQDPAAQDLYFAGVASAVFNAFTSGDAHPADLVKALTSSTQEQRLLLWSAHPREQEAISAAALGGSITGPSSGGASFGFFYNDGTGAKMDYYARRTVELKQSCQDPDSSQYSLRATLSNTAPPDAATSLPEYVTGAGRFGVVPGHIRTNYVVYGPAHSLVESATLNGQTIPIGSSVHAKRPVATVTVELAPTETAVLTVVFSRVFQDTEPVLRVTPSLAPRNETVLPFAKDPSCTGV